MELVDLVTITPDNITVQDSGGGELFNTDTKYLTTKNSVGLISQGYHTTPMLSMSVSSGGTVPEVLIEGALLVPKPFPPGIIAPGTEAANTIWTYPVYGDSHSHSTWSQVPATITISGIYAHTAEFPAIHFGKNLPGETCVYEESTTIRTIYKSDGTVYGTFKWAILRETGGTPNHSIFPVVVSITDPVPDSQGELAVTFYKTDLDGIAPTTGIINVIVKAGWSSLPATGVYMGVTA